MLERSLGVAAAVGVGALIAYLLRERSRLEVTLATETEHRNTLALELMATRNRLMHSAKSVEVGRAMKTNPTDVFVVTYPKCGTTWMTQIVHALRSDADMNFGEITEVVPWDILAYDCGQDLDGKQPGRFRVFKSHESFGTVPKGGRYIYVARDPLDAFFSFYKFLPSYTGLGADDIDQTAFSNAIFAGASHSGQIWDHFLGWWQHRDDPDVLIVFFEDLLADLSGEVRRIAAFLDQPLSEQLLSSVLGVSSHEFMSKKEHAHHFDDHFVRSFVTPKMGMDANVPVRVSKVRQDGGKRGTKKFIAPAVRARLEEKWAAVLEGPTGCKTYAEFRKTVRK